MEHLKRLLDEYYKSPEIFQAGRYWKEYEKKLTSEIEEIDLNQLRSSKYPILGTFGFTESIYHYHLNTPIYLKLIKKAIRKLFITNRSLLPYSLKIKDIREMAYRNCLTSGQLARLKSISKIETSLFGKPEDLFEIDGKNYTMQFLNFYIRLCFAQQHLKLTGNETIVELGSGSGFQVEILKKVFPELTIICFDLPHPLILCEEYLSQALGEQTIVKSSETISWKNMNNLQNGKIHMFGNWQFPILKNMKFDVFWNAASFGEMEPEIVQNYLSYVLGSCKSIYLLQARKGKESTSNSGVKKPITFEDYSKMLTGYRLINETDAYEAHRKMSQSGGYFQAVWETGK